MSSQFHFIKLFLLVGMVAATGCTHINATRNSERNGQTEHKAAAKASFVIAEDRGIASPKSKEKNEQYKNTEETLVILSLSGGGSRAAYWSSEIMLSLGKVFKAKEHGGLDLLKEVDVISSVSGGSLPAAYYAISKDKPTDTGTESSRLWNKYTVRKLMSRDYITRWFYNWFWPTNIAQYWFTGFDRSDIMAQTFADNLFDDGIMGWDLEFKDINTNRPNLILNATNGISQGFGTPFTFTTDHFHEKLGSQLSDYDIAWAVMATASFPAVFNYMTLKNYKATDDNKYVHVFDGGNSDNLGLTSVQEVIKKNIKDYDKVVVILVDAYTKSRGINRNDPDARKYFDFFIDTNFLDSTDSLLGNVRGGLLTTMKNDLNKLGKQAIFYHIGFDDIRRLKNTDLYDDRRLKDTDLYDDLNKIATNFKLSDGQDKDIQEAARLLIKPTNKCLIRIRNVILNTNKAKKQAAECHWPEVKKGEDH